MIRPRLPKVASGTRLTTNLVNNIINRTEYAADLLRQYKLTAGSGMYVEPHYDGTRVSYLQPVGGGGGFVRPLPIGPTPPKPINPLVLDCGGIVPWSKIDYIGYDICPNIGPPCAPTGESPSCVGAGVGGIIVSDGIWPNSCLESKSPKCAFSASFDDGGSIGSLNCPVPPGCISCGLEGTTDASTGYYNSGYFFMYISYSAQNGPQGGPYGFIGSGTFFMS